MLEDVYKSYKTSAQLIPNWDKMNKNDLVNAYVDCTDVHKREQYIGAIVCRYWGMLKSMYQKSYMAMTEEDCYDCFISSLLYALGHKAWRNPNSKLFNDANGPDKCINVTIASRRNTFFQQNNRFNRKINHGLASLEQLQEETNDTFTPAVDTISAYNSNTDVDLVRKIYNEGNNIFALIVDMIFTTDVFDFDEKTSESQFNLMKLVKAIRDMDDNYYKYFADTYGYEFDNVKNRFSLYAGKSKPLLKHEVEFWINTLNRK